MMKAYLIPRRPVPPQLVVRYSQPHDVYIGRPSKWGNPYSHKRRTHARFKVDTREQAIEAYRKWLTAQPHLVAQVKQELRGKVLGCWCSPLPCHGDVLAEIANA